MNSVNIIGRIGKEIELKYLQNGNAVANFSIAINQDYKKDGQKVEKTSWFDITTFGKTAENVNQYFRKGSMIGITGELEQQAWKAPDGTNRSKVIIKMQSFTFIDKKEQQDNQQQQGYSQQQQQSYQQQPQMSQQQGYQTPTQQQSYQPQPQMQQQMPMQHPAIENDEEIPF